MRVTINQDQSTHETGLIFKKSHTLYSVSVNIELTPQEEETLDKLNVWDKALFYRPNPRYEEERDGYEDDLSAPSNTWLHKHATPPQKTFPITVRTLCTDYSQFFVTPGEAKNHAQELRTHVKELKDIIDFNAAPPGPITETFDL